MSSMPTEDRTRIARLLPGMIDAALREAGLQALARAHSAVHLPQGLRLRLAGPIGEAPAQERHVRRLLCNASVRPVLEAWPAALGILQIAIGARPDRPGRAVARVVDHGLELLPGSTTSPPLAEHRCDPDPDWLQAALPATGALGLEPVVTSRPELMAWGTACAAHAYAGNVPGPEAHVAPADHVLFGLWAHAAAPHLHYLERRGAHSVRLCLPRHDPPPADWDPAAWVRGARAWLAGAPTLLARSAVEVAPGPDDRPLLKALLQPHHDAVARMVSLPGGSWPELRARCGPGR